MERVNLHPDLRYSEFNLDEIAFPPRKIPDFYWKSADLTTWATRNIKLKGIPLVSSPMDTVTGAKMAILLALSGAIGVIHYNFPTIEDQMREVEKVRRHEAGFIKNPLVLSKNATVKDVFLKAEKNGFFSYPVTEDGTLETRLVGIVTRRDVRYREDMETEVSLVMTPHTADKPLVVGLKEIVESNDIRAANKLIRENNLDTLPIVDDDFKVVALVTDSDLRKNDKHPLATKDDNKQLKVLIAVESFFEKAKERIAMAASFEASGIVVDSRNIFADHKKIAKFTKKEFPQLEVVVGNVVTAQVAQNVLEEYGESVDALRVGMGGGNVCETTERLGLGRMLGSAIRDVAEVRDLYRRRVGNISLWIDGGVVWPRHFIGGFILGADCAMMGTQLGGLEESPGEKSLNQKGSMVKKVRGMGSAEAIQERQGASRYGFSEVDLEDRYPEGTSKEVSYKGDGEAQLRSLKSGIKQAMNGLGCRDIKELRRDGYIVGWHVAPSKLQEL